MYNQLLDLCLPKRDIKSKID